VVLDRLVVLAQSPTRANVVLPPMPAGTDPNVSHAVRYRAKSGAIVFSVGSIQWVWALDDDRVTAIPRVKVGWRRKSKDWVKRLLLPGFAASVPKLPHVDRRAQQIAVNIFSEMGAIPGTPSRGIVVNQRP
jgi:hypothetical protein